ncbi:MAG: acetyl-CoA carboxylase biotin carboxyl carrier protein [Myxococcales bacterium]|nr:acetyl-CoA carboxylase biotin carboxyl carrier protein [Myxococcales bacterium]
MDHKGVRDMVRLMKTQGVAEFTWKQEGVELAVKFGGYAQPMAGAPPVAPAPAAVSLPATPTARSGTVDQKVVRAPIVGTFYRAPSPDVPAYASVGDKVRKGQVVCIIEAMKLMNQVESDVDGVVVEILVDNGQPVQFGQELFRLSPG